MTESTYPTAPSTESKGRLAQLLEHPKIVAAQAWIAAEYAKLSQRERVVLATAGIIIAGMASWSIYQPVRELFRNQTGRLERSRDTVESSSAALERYVKLKARRDMVKRDYRGVEIKEGAYAHIEKLIRSKLGIQSGFSIKDSSPKNMGDDFEQITYQVKFQVPALQPLVDFLKEVVQGERPLLLSSLEINKVRRGGGDTLDVVLETVVIRETKGQPAKKE